MEKSPQHDARQVSCNDPGDDLSMQGPPQEWPERLEEWEEQIKWCILFSLFFC